MVTYLVVTTIYMDIASSLLTFLLGFCRFPVTDGFPTQRTNSIMQSFAGFFVVCPVKFFGVFFTHYRVVGEMRRLNDRVTSPSRDYFNHRRGNLGKLYVLTFRTWANIIKICFMSFAFEHYSVSH